MFDYDHCEVMNASELLQIRCNPTVLKSILFRRISFYAKVSVAKTYLNLLK
jgi:hypothetical protein